jgi:hypothetical protein
MNRVLAAATVVAVLASAGFAQTVADDASEAQKPAKGVSLKAQSRVKGAESRGSYSYGDSEVWRDITIGPAQSVNLDSDISFYSSDTVRVSIRSRNSDLPNLEMNAYWAVPQALYWSVADVVTGEKFPYDNVGGVVFNTYGSQFRLRLTNTGSSTMYLAQVVIFTRVQ